MKLKIDLENKAQVVAASAFFNVLASELVHTIALAEAPIAKVNKPRKVAKVINIADGDLDKKAVMEKVAEDSTKLDTRAELKDLQAVQKQIRVAFKESDHSDEAKKKALKRILTEQDLTSVEEASLSQLNDILEEFKKAVKVEKAESTETEGVTLREVKSFFVSTQQADPAKGKILMGVIKAKGLSNLAEATTDQLADILKAAKEAIK